MLAQRLNCLKQDPTSPSVIIAEIGVNHNGDLEMARKMIVAAKLAGADAVKFQTFTAEALVTLETPKVPYQNNTTPRGESHYEMLQKLELRKEDHAPLMEICRQQKIGFLSTPYDLASARFLSKLGVEAFKIASADLVDIPLHQYIASTGTWAILATGMATLGEVETAMEPYLKLKQDKIVFLHCVSNYPCSIESLNLRAMPLLASTFNVQVGYSDHSIGTLAASLSIALGARIIEKHFTLDKSLPGPDHQASSTPQEFKALVKAIRQSELALGEAKKQCQEEEYRMSQISRKSLVLAKPMLKEEILTQEHLTCKRPGFGLKPNESRHVVGLRARRFLAQNTVIRFGDFE